MTVERHDTRDFDAELPRVVSALREVLSEGQSWHRYTELQETDGGVFEARIRPLFWPLVLSTGITITLHDKGSRTTVALETRSQWYIFGDVFNMYRGYIKDIFSSLESKLQGDA